MSESINTTEIIDTDLFTGTPEELETVEVSNENIVTEITDTVFGTDTEITAYKISTIVNAVFKANEFDKVIPSQMMYNYSRNGLIVKGEKGKKSYNKDQVVEFVLRYTNKQMR